MSDEPPASSRVRYRFPPLERRGVIAGWRAGQVATVAASLVLAVLSVRSRPSLGGVFVAVVLVGTGVATAFWPIAGRTGEQWLPVVARWGWAVATGHRIQVAPGPSSGATATVDPATGVTVGRPGAARPGAARPGAGGPRLGVRRDRRHRHR